MIFAHFKLNKLLEVQWQGKNARQKIFMEFYTRGLMPTAINMSLLRSFFQARLKLILNAFALSDESL